MHDADGSDRPPEAATAAQQPARPPRLRRGLAHVLLILLWLAAPGMATAEAPPKTPQLESLIETLEDDQARSRLVAQLRLMLDAGAREKEQAGIAESTAEALHGVSAATKRFFHQAVFVAGGVSSFPRLVSWLQEQAGDSRQRQLWLSALGNLALILAAGYLALYLSRLGLGRPRRLLTRQQAGHWWHRLGLLLLLGILLAMPIVAFAVTAYVVLGLSDPVEPVRLVALAWITAIVLMRAATLTGSLVFAAESPQLRLPRLGDESAHYAEIWIRRLAAVGIYGYFAIQSAALLGLPATAFDGLVHLLGLVLTALLMVLMLQNRTQVAVWIRGQADTTGAMQHVRDRLATYWHVPAAVYLAMLYGIWALSPENGFANLLRGTLLSLLAMVLGGAALRLLDHLFQSRLAIPRDLRERFPGLQTRANRYLPAVHTGLRIILYLAIALAILEAWGLGGFRWFTEDPGLTLASTAGSLLLIGAGTLMIWELTSLGIESYLAERDSGGSAQGGRSARSRTLLSVARTAVAVLLSVVAVLLALSEIGVDITPLLATAGVLGLAVGFGSQKLVQDLITGFFILLEDVFSVGDVIKVGDRAGLVEAVSIRNVRLRDLSGTVHTLPFSTIDTISNLTKEFSCHVFEIGVAYREDIDQVTEVIRDIGAELRGDAYFGPLIIDDLEVFGLDSFGDSAVVIKGRLKTQPIRQWEVGREFNRRVKKRFDALDIEIPFPHRTLYFGIDRDGNAPPVRFRHESAPGGA